MHGLMLTGFLNQPINLPLCFYNVTARVAVTFPANYVPTPFCFRPWFFASRANCVFVFFHYCLPLLIPPNCTTTNRSDLWTILRRIFTMSMYLRPASSSRNCALILEELAELWQRQLLVWLPGKSIKTLLNSVGDGQIYMVGTAIKQRGSKLLIQKQESVLTGQHALKVN